MKKSLIYALIGIALLLVACGEVEDPAPPLESNPAPKADAGPIIVSFTVDSSTVTIGGSTVLMWEVTGGTGAVMQPGDIEVDVSGTLPITLTTTTTYTLIVTGAEGKTAQASVSVMVTADPDDAYADPVGVEAPLSIPVEQYTLIPAMSLSAPNGAGLIQINVSGFELAAMGMDMGILSGGSSLPSDYFSVVEDGVVKGITVQKISDVRSVPIDILFVLDTTSSMGIGLTSVVESIEEFVDLLDESGLSVHVGAITFGDAFDTLLEVDEDDPNVQFGVNRSYGVSLMGATPPPHDDEERASFQLTDDYETFMNYLTYEGRGTAPYYGRKGWDMAENALGALEYAVGADFGWRAGAQKHFIVITDACSHTSVTSPARIVAPWRPTNFTQVLGKLRGHAQVHVVEPDYPACDTSQIPFYRRDFVMMKDFAGAEATGGVYVEWVSHDDFSVNKDPFDLTELPILDVMSNGYIVTYRGDITGGEHDVRLVIDNGDDVRGETTINATY